MPDLLSTPFVPRAPQTLPDERAARRSLLEQVARLEEELVQLFCSVWPRKGFTLGVAGRGGPRLLSLAELEELRDDLAARVQHARRAFSDRTYNEEQYRRLIEEMLLDPERRTSGCGSATRTSASPAASTGTCARAGA